MIRKMRTSSNRSRATLFNFVLLMPCSLVLRILRLPKSPMKWAMPPSGPIGAATHLKSCGRLWRPGAGSVRTGVAWSCRWHGQSDDEFGHHVASRAALQPSRAIAIPVALARLRTVLVVISPQHVAGLALERLLDNQAARKLDQLVLR